MRSSSVWPKTCKRSDARYASSEAPLLPGNLAQKAWHLWLSGLDAHAIAKLLGVTEAEVFNTIRALRELERSQFGDVLRCASSVSRYAETRQ